MQLSLTINGVTKTLHIVCIAIRCYVVQDEQDNMLSEFTTLLPAFRFAASILEGWALCERIP